MLGINAGNILETPIDPFHPQQTFICFWLPASDKKGSETKLYFSLMR